jgi:hypothetical protein
MISFLLLFPIIGMVIAKKELTDVPPHFKSSAKDSLSLSATSGGFPSNPSYGIVQYYSDYKCITPTRAASVLLNTCLVNSAGLGVMYNCSKLENKK